MGAPSLVRVRAESIPDRNLAADEALELLGVDLARAPVGARHHQQAPERDVLVDHHAELGDLVIAEVLSQLRDEARIRGPEIQRELLGKANRQPFARLQLAFFERQMNLRDRLFTEPLTRRRRVTCEESGVAVVQRRDLEPRQLLDPARHDTFLMARCEEREVTGEGFGDQRLEVESLTLSRFAAIHIVRGHASFSLVAARLRRGPQYIANARAAPMAA